MTALGSLVTWRFIYSLVQGWQSYGTRGQNGNGKDSLCTRPSFLFHLFLFLLPDQRLYNVKKKYVCVCVYTHTHTHICRVQNVYELPLLPNNTVSETFLYVGSGAVLIIGATVSGWIRDIGQNVFQSSFYTGSSSTPSYFHVFFLISFLDEDFSEI
jgi:hypothetical protein